MTTKQASDLRIGDVVCEADGFEWKVSAIAVTPATFVLSLDPVFQSIVREQSCKMRVRKTAQVRVAA